MEQDNGTNCISNYCIPQYYILPLKTMPVSPKNVLGEAVKKFHFIKSQPLTTHIFNVSMYKALLLQRKV